MADKQHTPQNEEVAANSVQPEKATVEEVPVVVEPEKPTEESKVDEEPTSCKLDPVKSVDSAPVDEVQEKPADEEVDHTSEAEKQEDPEKEEEKISNEEKSVELVEKAVEANGGEHTDGKVESAEEETNGVCKRKAENGAESNTESEKPSKIAKVVDGDQATVEETAA